MHDDQSKFCFTMKIYIGEVTHYKCPVEFNFGGLRPRYQICKDLLKIMETWFSPAAFRTKFTTQNSASEDLTNVEWFFIIRQNVYHCLLHIREFYKKL